MTSRIAYLAAIAALPCLFSACQGDPRPLGWELEFEGDLARNARVVEARIREGTCSGDIIYTIDIRRTGPVMMTEAPVLDDGMWSFEGRAFTSTCQLYAQGCTTVTLPTPGPVVVSMGDRAVIDACPASQCTDGLCSATGSDGGARDAGPAGDAGPCTGCMLGGACVAGTNLSACGTGGEMCEDCGECGACRSGACMPSDGSDCMDGAGICRGGSCCTGCWDGTSCEVGNTGVACGANGGSCNTCTDCVGCTAGACGGMAAEGAACSVGLCHGTPSACCAGCWNGSICVPGDTPMECGTDGVPCVACPAPQSCIGHICT